MVVAPPAVIDGVAGFARTLTTIGAEDGEAQPFASM